MKWAVTKPMSLLEALAELAPQSSKTAQRSWLKEGRVVVDGETVKLGTTVVYPGQTVTLQSKARFVEGDVNILYEDRWMVVIDKPEGLLSVSTAFEKSDTAFAILKRHYKPGEVHVVHRIDQDTSGVMVFARTEEAKERFKQMFEKHALERAYTAIIEGSLDQSSGTWQSYLYEDESYTVHETEDPAQGRLAITHYAQLGRNRKYAWLQLRLETGRKNQIRVHCQQAGHSIVGDKKYGAKTNPLKRLGLHAHLLGFQHPMTNKQMRFESPLPLSFQKIMRNS
jgi:tRNA pseudouridine32 synthase/23S rRNA pseudouridine746 synthase/23S rRNA pseudouridine1911/1915/1917 synthase